MCVCVLLKSDVILRVNLQEKETNDQSNDRIARRYISFTVGETLVFISSSPDVFSFLFLLRFGFLASCCVL